MSKSTGAVITPAILVIGYSRPNSLSRLLKSIGEAEYGGRADIPLLICLDHSGVQEVRQAAEAFHWPHGPKRVIHQPTRLGLREHVLRCGDLSQEYGAVIVLEDDLVVSPHFYAYAEAAAQFYDGDPRVGGISLYDYRMNEYTNATFMPLDDGYDTYFLQVASSWGQMWTASQWKLFRNWYDEHHREPLTVADGIPKHVTLWRETSWKKYYIRYLSISGRYFAYPRHSLTTNFSDPGVHTRRVVDVYQTPLAFGPRQWRLGALDDALAVYDTYYEISPASLTRLNPGLAGFDFSVDLMGTKPAEAMLGTHAISLKSCGSSERQFGLSLVPPEANIATGVAGTTFSLAPVASFGALGHDKRLAVSRHMNRHNAFNEYLFAVLKPIQMKLLGKLK